MVCKLKLASKNSNVVKQTMPWVFYLVKKQEGDTVFMVFSSSFLVSLLERYQICFPNPTMCISSSLIQKWSKAKYPYLNPNTLPAWEARTFRNNTQTRDNPFLFLGLQVNSCTNFNNLQSKNLPTSWAMVASNWTLSCCPAKETNYPILRNKKERRSTSGLQAQASSWVHDVSPTDLCPTTAGLNYKEGESARVCLFYRLFFC